MLNYVLSPDSDSELSGISDDEDIEPHPNIQNDIVNEECETEKEDESDDDPELHPNGDGNNAPIIQRVKRHEFRWRSIQPPDINSEFQGEKFSLPPGDFDELYPYDYFSKFWSADITKLLVDQTNLYSTQLSGKSINTSCDEIEQFLGIQMLMGFVKMPNYHAYWKTETRFEMIADVLSHNRYKVIRRYIHSVDNTERDKHKGDKLFKIRTILQMVRNNCSK